MISHAISGDGYNWVKDTANPVLSPTVPWENFGPSGITADMSQPYVMIHPSLGNFLMCYGSFDATIYERYSGFGYASSNDGSNWTKDLSNPFFLPDTLKQGEEIGIHANSIVYVNGLYHMFYGGINNVGARNILHATANSFPLNSRKILNSTHLKLYPNPVTNELLIENGDLPIDIIEIISITGEKIKTILPKANKIDLTNLPIGMYLIYIKSKSIIITRKLIKY